MNYSITPVNVFAVIAIIVMIYTYRPNVQGDGYVNFWNYVFGMVAIAALVVDFLLQKFTNNYGMLVKVEGAILLFLFVVPLIRYQAKTFVLPQNFSQQYVVTIYGVEGAPKFCSTWTRFYKKQVPENGIMVTSTTIEDDISNTKIISHTGQDLNTNESMTRWMPFDENTITCNGKNYRYQSWKIDNPTDVYQRTEMALKELKEQLTAQCEDILKQ